MRRIVVLVFISFISNAFALALHYGNESVELTTVKHTTPSLNVLTHDGHHYYGALFTAPFPQSVIHIHDGTTEYYLGPWCNAGTYLPDGEKQCTPCGIGHYCMGGKHRESCTYGAIACNGTNHTFDPQMPAGTSGMYNRALTMAEVNQYIPVTDIEQWEMIFSGETSSKINFYAPCGTSPNDPRFLDTGIDITIPAGTYMVGHIYSHEGYTSAVTGHSGFVSSAYIVVFDHDVVYRPIHMCGVFHNYFDTQHIPFQEYDLQLPSYYHDVNENITNITDISDVFTWYHLILYRLK